jgi:hypothetical protein
VSVTACPEQTVGELTETVGSGFTDIVIVELAVVWDKQEALDVNIQVTICPFVKEKVVYVELFVPTLVPFTCH